MIDQYRYWNGERHPFRTFYDAALEALGLHRAMQLPNSD
jgi:hypothetical protein